MQSEALTIPPEFICPISHTIMEDPVLTVDGSAYDRMTIQSWFNKGNHVSPLTGFVLENRSLIPCYALKSLIETFKKTAKLKNGKGIEYWADGGRYQGQYKNGRRHGQGIEYWSDGGRFQGQFFNGRREGKGTEYWSDGGKFEGIYSNGKREGFGRQFWSDGGSCEGEYKNGCRDGSGSDFYADGSTFRGQFKNGRKHGKGILFVNQEIEELWENGKKISSS